MPDLQSSQSPQSQPGAAQRPQTSPMAASAQFAREEISIGLPWKLMIFSFVLFLFSLFIFAGLRFGYNAYLDSQTEGLDQDIETLASQISEGEQEELLVFYSQLVNLEKTLQRRGFSQNIFSFLEDNTLSSVYYTELSYDALAESVALNGEAASMQNFVEQMTVLENHPLVNRVSLEELSTRGQAAVFSLRVSFLPEFFKTISS